MFWDNINLDNSLVFWWRDIRMVIFMYMQYNLIVGAGGGGKREKKVVKMLYQYINSQ